MNKSIIRNKVFILACVILTFSSCDYFETKIILEKFVDTRIEYPKTLDYFYEGNDTTSNIIDKHSVKMLVYFDSKECSSCNVRHISDWSEILKYNKWTRGKIGVIFLFSPNYKEYNEVKHAINNMNLDSLIIILDKDENFIKINPNIPKSKRYHTFLLDDNNKVILVGSPIKNKNMWELYKKEIIKRSK